MNKDKKERILRIIYLVAGIICFLIGLFLIMDVLGVTGDVVYDGDDIYVKTPVGIIFLAGGIGFIYLAKKGKRGQQSIEFLFTYGWTILGALAATGIVAYYMTAPNFSASSAVLSPPLIGGGVSNEDQGNNQALVSFEFSNGAGYSILVESASISNLPQGSCQPLTGLSISLLPNERTVLQFTCIGIEKGTGEVSVIFRKSGSSLSQSSNGRINIPRSGSGGSSSGSSSGGSSSSSGSSGGVGDTFPPEVIINSIGGDTTEPFVTTDATPLVLAVTNENADCKASPADQSYDDMSLGISGGQLLTPGFFVPVDCTGDGTTEHSCQIGEVDEGVNEVYVACKDTAGNKNGVDDNADATFTLEVAAPPSPPASPPDF